MQLLLSQSKVIDCTWPHSCLKQGILTAIQHGSGETLELSWLHQQGSLAECVECCWNMQIVVTDLGAQKGLGETGDLTDVTYGYWRNYLQPYGLAALCTQAVLE